ADSPAPAPQGGLSLQSAAVRPRSSLRDLLRRFARNRLAVVGMVIVTALCAAALFAPWLAPADPAQQHLDDKRMPPSLEYPLGADEFGRDILSRIIYGARVALFVAVVAVAIAMLLGVSLGLVAAYIGGWVETIIMGAVD